MEGGDTAEGTGLNSQALAPSCSIVSPSRDHKYTHNFQSHSQRHAAALKDKSIELLSELAIFSLLTQFSFLRYSTNVAFMKVSLMIYNQPAR